MRAAQTDARPAFLCGPSVCFRDSTDAPDPITGATAVPFFDVHGDHDGRVYPFLAAFTSRYLQHLGVQPSKNRLASEEPALASLVATVA
jgi:hypothetical protein